MKTKRNDRVERAWLPRGRGGGRVTEVTRRAERSHRVVWDDGRVSVVRPELLRREVKR
jgi:hypothetical protein